MLYCKVNKNILGAFFFGRNEVNVADARTIPAEILTILTGAALNSGRISETIHMNFCIIRHHSFNFVEKSITVVIPSREVFLARMHVSSLPPPSLSLSPLSSVLAALVKGNLPRPLMYL